MADISRAPRSPLAGWQQTFASLAPAVELTETPAAQAIVRTADPQAITRLDLPGVCCLRRDEDEVAVWLGPDEWLLYRPGISGHEFAAEVAARARDGAYVMDASGQRTILVLGGCRASTILAHGCAIDFSENAFPDDQAVSTLLAQAGVVIHRGGRDDTYVLVVRSSFADYLADWLVDAAAEYVVPDTSTT
ncbi:sarcosine oxidase subunit gamma [Gordonia aichiensis]|uniref:Sarcosine oxidase gamma subunit n=1 Tax=Gordonia aichiensis NBRC 108223 TaxID=1220583 RepID=L7KK50_9ACTN|nr:sarcosine oxidase subunit gamma family protein [Gordonia aichiensis]GAC49260.1 sarcosine oxidase gamma subunit [Gordonia aichiensis NBRC 108223]